MANSGGMTPDALIGAWTLVAWYETRPDGRIDYPLGEDALGMIIYSADGHVSAQLVRRDMGRFRSEDWRQAAADESCAAWKAYFGYFGRYTLDTERATVTHHIEGTWFPNLFGTDQVRHYRFDGTRLTLDADTAWGRVCIIWKRAVRPS
jgi:hypothetical protein